MTAEDIKKVIVDALTRIAPEIDPASIESGASFRDQLDLDSMDFLNFVIALHDLQISGFHSPISEKEAGSILDFLKAGPPDTKTFAYPENQETWTLAKSLLICCFDKPVGKDQRRRQLLLMSAKGLVCELAFALHISTQEAVALIRKSLERHCTVNPLVLNALACAAE